MLRRELIPVSVAAVGVLVLALGGVFHARRLDGREILHQEAAYAAAIVNGRRPLVVSFYSGRRLVRRKVADPGQKYLAVYDSDGSLLRWERGNVFYLRSSRAFCYQRMTGQDYVGRLYLPSLPLHGLRDIHVSQDGDSLTISWLSRAGRGTRTNTLEASYGSERLDSYRYSGASLALSYPAGSYVFSYPRRVVPARAPSSEKVCSTSTQRLSG